MPPIFASTSPTCPRCHKAVYHAEQTLALGVAWHRLCLKCVECNKLLEPRLLVDHDGQAYCKPCHSKSFGAKGYGAGGALVGEYTPRSTPSSPSKDTISRSTVSKPDFDEDDTRDTYVAPLASLSLKPAPAARRPVPIPPVVKSVQRPPSTPEVAATLPPPPPPRVETAVVAPPALIASETISPPTVSPVESTSLPPAVPAPPSPTLNKTRAPPPLAPKPSFSSSRPSFGSPTSSTVPSISAAAPASPPAPTVVAQPPQPAPAPVPASKPRPSWSTPTFGGGAATSKNKDLCQGCSTVVYFAEEVRAVGGKWHKRCLRCTSCSTSLSPNTLAERDGAPFCRACYAKSGGGLVGGMGVMTRPNLY